jgi:DNA-binding NarL/FixJ family response regulator
MLYAMTAPLQTSVLLADDNRYLRVGLRELINMEEDMNVVGEAEDGHQAVMLAHKLSPDVIVMDISMPRLSGLEATRQILQRTTSTKILVLSGHGEDAYVEQCEALGASGYVSKSAAPESLPAAIRRAQQGSPFFGPQSSSNPA